MTHCVRLYGYQPPYFWQLNGLLSLNPVSAAGALDGQPTTDIDAAAGQGSFDGFRQAFTGLLIDITTEGNPAPGISIRQRVDGSAGTTTVEIYRLRSGTWTLLGSVSLAFGGGGGAAASMVPATVPLCALYRNDVLVAVLVAAQTGGQDLTVAVSFG